MSDQQGKIAGHRNLEQAEIDLINECKALDMTCDRLVNKLKQIVTTDKRWVAIGATDLQTGFMALARSVAQLSRIP